MNAELQILNIVLFGAILFLLTMGLPLVFCLFGVALVGLFYLMGEKGILVVYFNVISTDRYFLLISVPLFVFMAGMLERSGVAEDLYQGIQLWMGNLAGGLAIGTVITLVHGTSIWDWYLALF